MLPQDLFSKHSEVESDAGHTALLFSCVGAWLIQPVRFELILLRAVLCYIHARACVSGELNCFQMSDEVKKKVALAIATITSIEADIEASAAKVRVIKRQIIANSSMLTGLAASSSPKGNLGLCSAWTLI